MRSEWPIVRTYKSTLIYLSDSVHIALRRDSERIAADEKKEFGHIEHSKSNILRQVCIAVLAFCETTLKFSFLKMAKVY